LHNKYEFHLYYICHTIANVLKNLITLKPFYYESVNPKCEIIELDGLFTDL